LTRNLQAPSLGECNKKIEKIKSIPEGVYKDCTDVGLGAVMLWTSNLLYKQCNEALRHDSGIDRWRPYLNTFIRGVWQLPYYQGTVFRGIPNIGDKLFDYPEGEIICWKTVTAFSKQVKVAHKFAKGQAGVLFEVDVLSSREISQLSFYPNEEEVLLLPYSHFQIVEVLPSNVEEDKPAVVKMREVPVPQSTKVVFWVDDNPQNNVKWIKELHKQEISVVCATTTQQALSLLDTYKWLLYLDEADIRVVSDMVRIEEDKDKPIFDAGVQFVSKLRERGFGHKVLIFCKDVKAARNNCISAGVMNEDNLIITASTKNLLAFLHFLHQPGHQPTQQKEPEQQLSSQDQKPEPEQQAKQETQPKPVEQPPSKNTSSCLAQ